ncbi:MAG: hypothetical protein ACLSIR_10350 [Christensenellales bacterium]
MYYVSLKQFEGPLDLLLHLITRAKVDIKDILFPKSPSSISRRWAAWTN